MKKTIYLILVFAILFSLSGCDFFNQSKKFSVTVNYDETHGSVTGAGKYKEGDTVTLKSSPNEGYVLEKWLNENEKIVSTQENYTFTMPDSDVSLSVIFSDVSGLEQYTITVYYNDSTNKIITMTGYQGLLLNEPDNITNGTLVIEGWYTDELLKNKWDFKNDTVISDLNLYANWIESSKRVDHLDIYYFNDLHGAIEKNTDNGRLGLAYIANFLKNKTDSNPDNTIIIAGGDMFQGGVMSNYNNGEYSLDMFNEIGFDAFVIGNHEFDWGLNEILKYHDGNQSNKEADYPLLGANVFYKNTTTMVENLEPYTVIERGNIKIGIIGTIGSGLESSILASRVEDYYFADPYTEIRKYAEILRVEENCDIVISSIHDPGSSSNDRVAGLTGNYAVDVIFNAHDHVAKEDSINGIPILEAGAEGKYVGHVTLNLNESGDNAFRTETELIASDSLLNTPDPVINNLISGYKAKLDPIYGVEYLKSGDYIDKYQLTAWIAEVMAKKTGAMFGFQNTGGTRIALNYGQSITGYAIYDIFPFDNIVISADCLGADIQSYMNRYDYYYAEIGSYAINPSEYYRIATNNYVFYDNSGASLRRNAINITEHTDLVLNDLMAEELILQSKVYPAFYASNPILITYGNMMNVIHYYQDKEDIFALL